MATFPPSSLALPQPRASLGSRARACLAARPRAHPADPRPPAPPRKLSGRRRRARGSLARPRGLLSSLLHTRHTRPHPLRSGARPARAVWRRQRRARAAPPPARDRRRLSLAFFSPPGPFQTALAAGAPASPPCHIHIRRQGYACAPRPTHQPSAAPVRVVCPHTRDRARGPRTVTSGTPSIDPRRATTRPAAG